MKAKKYKRKESSNAALRKMISKMFVQHVRMKRQLNTVYEFAKLMSELCEEERERQVGRWSAEHKDGKIVATFGKPKP